MSSQPAAPREAPSHFIRQIVVDDRAAGRHGGRVATRFPPEPNGYLHVGHAKSICLNFGMAAEFGGVCHLRFDDTNPVKEDLEYVRSIQDDVRWLGFEWDVLLHASDYFETFYLCAEKLVRQGVAFVCDLSAEQVREYRGTLTEPGRNSPWRDRPVAESLDLLRRMRAGEFADGARTLRAKIDMASGNINLRDPAIYRIRKVDHQMTGDAWCIYPMYDYAHCISDAVEGITHSLCTLEFEDHRPLYDWFLRATRPARRPRADRAAARTRPGHAGVDAAADRVLAPEPRLHRDEQAQADGAGRRRPGRRLGRPAHAHALGACAAAASPPPRSGPSASAWA